MDDYEQLDIMGYNWKPRLETKKIIFESLDPKKVNNSLTTDRIDILYFPKILQPKINLEDIGLEIIFENDEIEVWQRN